ncbi:MAG: TraR/DksA C4-type zinc finger protein [Acidimicrobiia bacterium]|nr:TraR/DksA C4-type zinc finger protein [Acidimicrobiia bacterium]
MADALDPNAVRSELEGERERVRKHIDELNEGDPSFDDGFADSGQVAAEQGEAHALANSLREQLDDIEAALRALDDGSYGTCEVCSEPIADARLEAMPTTRRCIQHA